MATESGSYREEPDMSEGAPESTGAVTEPGQGPESQPGTGEAEDQEASNLLHGMAEQDPAELARQVEHWKTMSRKHEGRARENSAAAAKLQEIEDQNKTELQRATEARETAERERDEARADHSRVMAAAAHNLPVELIDYLGTGTDEEINGRAETFAGVIDAAAQELANEILSQSGGSRNGSLGARPVESMRAGSAPATGGMPRSNDEWFRNLITGRE